MTQSAYFVAQDPAPKGVLRIALAQAQPSAGNVIANLDTVRRLSEEASDKGAKLINFPEKFLTGYEPELLKQVGDAALIKSDDEAVRSLSNLSKIFGLTIIVGAPTLIDGIRRISSVIAMPNGSVHFYHKQHLFHSEKEWFVAGNEDKQINVSDWRIGLGICYDSGFPEHARRLAVDHCDLYLVSALFSKKIGRQELAVWMPARALDNTLFVAMSNYCGTTGGWDTCGGSGLWSPMGECIVQADENPTLLIADLKPQAIHKARESEQMLGDYIALYSKGVE